MTRTSTKKALEGQTRTASPVRKATVVHDGCAFQLAGELRRRGYQVSEGPLLSPSSVHGEADRLAVIASRPGSARSDRLREWARQLCWHGAPVLAIGAAVGAVAELFGSSHSEPADPHGSGRLADIRSASEGLFTGLPTEFRLELSAGERFEMRALSGEFSTTAWSRDGELIGASHVFRPVHLLHPAALENGETRPIVLENLTRLLREKGGRAF